MCSARILDGMNEPPAQPPAHPVPMKLSPVFTSMTKYECDSSIFNSFIFLYISLELLHNEEQNAS